MEQALAAIARAERPEVWISRFGDDVLLARAAAVDPALPLAGITVAVKDNIDVAGLPTTAGCPAYAYEPAASAPVVRRLEAAGAIVLGKTNLDQFATGLVGTRSPYGAVADARRPERVAGGSSSGSAVAVALGMADLALGTDTAGSGRVPVAYAGLVGLKPTRGLVPNRGSVPACRSFDCVSVMARSLALAERALAVIAGPDSLDPTTREAPADVPFAAPPAPRVAIPAAPLPELTPAGAEAFAAACAALAAAGAELVPVDVAPLLQAGALLYGGAFVAERFDAVGAFVVEHPDAVDPTVGAIIAAAADRTAAELAGDLRRLDALRVLARGALAGTDALLLPTTPFQPTLAEVADDPVGVNARVGTFTTFANLLDLCVAAVPAGEADGGHFGVSVLAPAFHDAVAADVARLLVGAEPPPAPAADTPVPEGAVELLVVGAHRTGQPLAHELTDRGARCLGLAWTAPEYRLFRLDTVPRKPGLARVDGGGAAIEGELWALSPAALGSLLAALPAPMGLGPVTLAGGRVVVGFLCEALALEGAEDITAHGSWPAALAAG